MACAKEGAEFLGAHIRRIGRRKARAAVEIPNHRVERAVAVIGRALQIDARMSFGRKLLLFPDC